MHEDRSLARNEYSRDPILTCLGSIKPNIHRALQAGELFRDDDFLELDMLGCHCEGSGLKNLFSNRSEYRAAFCLGPAAHAISSNTMKGFGCDLPELRQRSTQN